MLHFFNNDLSCDCIANPDLLALVYEAEGRHRMALEVWSRLGSGEYEESAASAACVAAGLADFIGVPLPHTLSVSSLPTTGKQQEVGILRGTNLWCATMSHTFDGVGESVALLHRGVIGGGSVGRHGGSVARMATVGDSASGIDGIGRGNVPQITLIWQYSEWLLLLHPKRGMRIFTGIPPGDGGDDGDDGGGNGAVRPLVSAKGTGAVGSDASLSSSLPSSTSSSLPSVSPSEVLDFLERIQRLSAQRRQAAATDAATDDDADDDNDDATSGGGGAAALALHDLRRDGTGNVLVHTDAIGDMSGAVVAGRTEANNIIDGCRTSGDSNRDGCDNRSDGSAADARDESATAWSSFAVYDYVEAYIEFQIMYAGNDSSIVSGARGLICVSFDCASPFAIACCDFTHVSQTVACGTLQLHTQLATRYADKATALLSSIAQRQRTINASIERRIKMACYGNGSSNGGDGDIVDGGGDGSARPQSTVTPVDRARRRCRAAAAALALDRRRCASLRTRLYNFLLHPFARCK